jgi:pantoate--beta-alanine ligase
LYRHFPLYNLNEILAGAKMAIPVLATIADLRTRLSSWRVQSRIALVPTMGALHEGHAELIREARRQADQVVVSVFVNPTQFGPKEDYSRYPRTLEADCQVAEAAGATVIFAPTVQEMYPGQALTFVEVGQLDQVLCGPRRPGHFRGVCTVVLKLFNIVQPDLAVFGQKDAQQALILRKMVQDLNVPLEFVVAPTVREPDGLALSSRNRYLTPEERHVAPGIYQALQRVQKRVQAGEWDVARLQSALTADLAAIPGARVDYAEILDAELLTPMARLDRPALAAVAVFLGNTRLIDNIVLG